MLDLDYTAVHADDALLDMLGRAAEPDCDVLPCDVEPDDKVAALLLWWRLDVDADPIREFQLDWFNGWAA